jgi:hypothetical protein
VDKAPPTVTISTPAPGAAYTLNQPVTATYSCSDVGSGVASCTAKVGSTSIANGGAIPTSAVGVYTLTVTATDVAGNTTVQSVTYDVTYGICNFTPPIGPVGSLLVFNVTLCDYTGKNVSSSSITISAVDVDGTMPESGNFTYVVVTNSYSFVLNTTGLPAGNHVLDVAVTGDPLHHALAFTLT